MSDHVDDTSHGSHGSQGSQHDDSAGSGPACSVPMPEATEQRLRKLEASKPIMESVNLDKHFYTGGKNIHVLDAINHRVWRRELCCVIGPSGCGKSTFIRLLAGLEIPSDGQVKLDDREVIGPGPDRGMVFQAYSLFPWLTVLRNVMFGMLEQGKGLLQAESEARQWIEMVGLDHAVNHYPHQLSGGMKQRVAIARALAAGPRMLMMDEPFSALDPQTRQEMQQHLMQIHANTNLTILFVTHDLDEALMLADRIIVMSAHPGRIRTRFEVPLPRHRPPELAHSKEFLEVRSYLDQLVHEPAHVEPLPIPNLVPVDSAE